MNQKTFIGQWAVEKTERFRSSLFLKLARIIKDHQQLSTNLLLPFPYCQIKQIFVGTHVYVHNTYILCTWSYFGDMQDVYDCKCLWMCVSVSIVATWYRTAQFSLNKKLGIPRKFPCTAAASSVLESSGMMSGRYEVWLLEVNKLEICIA